MDVCIGRSRESRKGWLNEQSGCQSRPGSRNNQNDIEQWTLWFGLHRCWQAWKLDVFPRSQEVDEEGGSHSESRYIATVSLGSSHVVASQIVDNVIRQGRVSSYPEDTDDVSVLGTRKLLQHLKTDKDVDATTIATVGEKAWDGFTYAIKLWYWVYKNKCSMNRSSSCQGSRRCIVLPKLHFLVSIDFRRMLRLA